jgi:hypothetical protein
MERDINPLARARTGAHVVLPAGDAGSSDDEVDASVRAAVAEAQAGMRSGFASVGALRMSSVRPFVSLTCHALLNRVLSHDAYRFAASQVHALRAFYAAQRYAHQARRARLARVPDRELSRHATSAAASSRDCTPAARNRAVSSSTARLTGQRGAALKRGALTLVALGVFASATRRSSLRRRCETSGEPWSAKRSCATETREALLAGAAAGGLYL